MLDAFELVGLMLLLFRNSEELALSASRWQATTSYDEKIAQACVGQAGMQGRACC